MNVNFTAPTVNCCSIVKQGSCVHVRDMKAKHIVLLMKDETDVINMLERGSTLTAPANNGNLTIFSLGGGGLCPLSFPPSPVATSNANRLELLVVFCRYYFCPNYY